MEHTPYKVSTITIQIPAPFSSCSHGSHRLVQFPMGSHIRWHQGYWAGGEVNYLLSAMLGVNTCNFKPFPGCLSSVIYSNFK